MKTIEMRIICGEEECKQPRRIIEPPGERLSFRCENPQCERFHVPDSVPLIKGSKDFLSAQQLYHDQTK